MKLIFLAFSILATASALKQSLGELGDHFEGDMMLTNLQRRELFGRTPGRRVGAIDTRYRWPQNTLVYEFANDVSSANRALAEQAMKKISDSTCVKFVRRTNQRDYVHVTTNGKGCASRIGRIGGQQITILQDNPDPNYSCWHLGTVTHEFLHALGFFHAQSAPNRDQYVEILWQNIKPAAMSQFMVLSNKQATMFGLPYDYDSVMHYYEKAFSKNGQPTILPLKDGVTIGRRNEMSTLDIKRVNRMYNCPTGQ